MLGALHAFRIYRAVRFLFLAPFILLICFVVNWMRYAYGHQETAADNALLDALTSKLVDGSYSVQSLVVDLTQTRSFVYRPGDGS